MLLLPSTSSAACGRRAVDVSSNIRPPTHRVLNQPSLPRLTRRAAVNGTLAPPTNVSAHLRESSRTHQRAVAARSSATDDSTTAPPSTSAAPPVDANPPEASVAEEHHWPWKYSSRIRYFKAGTSGPPILLVHGFGVGAYHYERNIPELAQNHRVWSIDLLGQGSSWPQQDPRPEDEKLYYSIDTWTQQLHDFIQENIGEPAYVVGNSLGGYLAVSLAATRPGSVAGLVLLNATPFWSFRPHPESPGGSGGVWDLLPFDGAVPLPAGVKRNVEVMWWDKLRSPTTVQSMIQMVYANKDAADQRLVQRIVDATLHPRALDAFASIVFSPKTRLSFDDMVDSLSQPICLLYGRDDPWVVPLWGQRLKRQVPDATYLEITPAGHCPHHEAPTAVNQMIAQWVQSVETGADFAVPLSSSVEFEEACAGAGTRVVVSHIEGRPRNPFEWLDYLLAQLRRRPARSGSRGGKGGSGDSESGAELSSLN